MCAITNQQQRFLIAYANGFCTDEFSDDPKRSICASYHRFSDQYGILSGPAFSLSFATMSIFGGLIADKFNRRMLIIFACALWSTMSVLSGTVDSFGLFYFCRFGLGVFQSFFNPTSYSIISDVFHKDYRTTANSVFNLGIYFGGGLASMSQALIDAIGWR